MQRRPNNSEFTDIDIIYIIIDFEGINEPIEW